MKIEAIKKKAFEIIEPCDDKNKIGKIVDMFIVILIIVNIVIIVAETFDFFNNSNIFHIIEIFSIVIFTVEYAIRIWTSDLMAPEQNKFVVRIKYIFSFMALIDLFAILPFYIPLFIPYDLLVIRSLRIARLLRFFKVNRYTKTFATIGAVFKKKASQLISSAIIIFLLLLITSVLMYEVEHKVQPEKFANAFSSIWWTISTITTVGYGDIYPVTTLGQVLSSVISFLSIGLIAIPSGIISAGFVEQVESEKDKSEDAHNEKCFCPYCGHNLQK